MAGTYKAVMLTKVGGPEVLQVVDLPIQEPGQGELRVRVKATGVGATDLTMRAGNYPYAPKIPFVPGYEIAGVVDAVGPGVTSFKVGDRVAALTVHGGHAELLVRTAADFVAIPPGVSDAEAAAVILNGITAYQALHRVAHVQPGQTVLVTGAAGGVGSAAVQLAVLAGAKVYGAASLGKHAAVKALGATPLDYKAGRLDEVVQAAVPGGVDIVLDGIGGPNIGLCIGALRPGGHLVAYGFMAAGGPITTALMFANVFVGSRLRGRKGSFYGITLLYRKDPKPLHEDLPKLFALMADKKFDPTITHRMPFLDVANAQRLLESGTVAGKIVLVAE